MKRVYFIFLLHLGKRGARWGKGAGHKRVHTLVADVAESRGRLTWCGLGSGACDSSSIKKS